MNVKSWRSDFPNSIVKNAFLFKRTLISDFFIYRIDVINNY